jgi:hypothetical protein
MFMQRIDVSGSCRTPEVFILLILSEPQGDLEGKYICITTSV